MKKIKIHSDLKGITVESPMTMCEQSVKICAGENDLEGITVESPMTMCEQSVKICAGENDLRGLSESPVNFVSNNKSSVDYTEDELIQYSTIYRMVS